MNEEIKTETNKATKKESAGSQNIPFLVCAGGAAVILIILAVMGISYLSGAAKNKKNIEDLQNQMARVTSAPVENNIAESVPVNEPSQTDNTENNQEANTDTEQLEENSSIVEALPTATPTPPPLVMMSNIETLYNQNNDLVGWIRIEGTDINYPIMQTFDDPATPDVDESEYYLYRDFYGKLNEGSHKPGSIFAHQDSVIGKGYRSNEYYGGVEPSDNIIIFGHNMASGQMFGTLYKFLDQDYVDSHNIILFASLYEDRAYQIVSVFRTHVFLSTDLMNYNLDNDPNFKYYKFTSDLNEETYHYWINNIVSHSQITTTYDFGEREEFLVLSTCSSTDETGGRNQNGRICLVAVRIR